MEKGEIVPIHFIWECEGLEDQDYVNGWKTHMEFHTSWNDCYFMIYQVCIKSTSSRWI